ncbi:HEAT repeat domain-containing protein [candidate division KSB1 bacterium]|nr:HEAT repeat domain-containing protein [candidate division KSB1 bacterium]
MKKIAFWRLVRILVFTSCVCASTQPVIATLPQIDSLFSHATEYEYGENRQCLNEIHQLINKKNEDSVFIQQIELKIIKQLQTNISIAGTQFFCRELHLIGTKASVPILAQLLNRDETANSALYALEQIPGKPVSETLRDALKKTRGDTKVGIINALGQRADESAVKPLSKLLFDKDEVIATAAAGALGKIATADARTVLSKAVESTSGNVQDAVLESYLACADKSLQIDNRADAARIYGTLYHESYPLPIRLAAFRGLLQTAGDQAFDLIRIALLKENQNIQAVAISYISELPDSLSISRLSASWNTYSPLTKIRLLSVFSERSESAFRQTALVALEDSSRDVRVAALKSFSTLGMADDIEMLAHWSIDGSHNEQMAAQESLTLLNSKNIDETIINLIPTADDSMKIALIHSTADRNITDACDTLIATLIDDNPNVRRECWRSLGMLASMDHFPKLVTRFDTIDDTNEMKRAEQALISIAKRNDAPACSEIIIHQLKDETSPERFSAFIHILGNIGNDAALPTMRKALTDKRKSVRRAAIDALGDWPSSSPRADLEKIARTSRDVDGILALRGYIDLVDRDTTLLLEERFALYKNALPLATQKEEKQMILAGVSKIGLFDALDLAKSLLYDDQLKPEAEMAIIKISNAIQTHTLECLRTEVNNVIENSANVHVKDEGKQFLKRNSQE